MIEVLSELVALPLVPRRGEADSAIQGSHGAAITGRRMRVLDETLSGVCAGWPVRRRVPTAADDDLSVRLLDPDQSRRGRQAVRGVLQVAAIQLSVRFPALADDRGGR